MSREAMQLALGALESDPISHAGLVSRKQAITALRQALKTEQEPVAVVFDPYDAHGLQWLCQHPPHRGDKLYLSPPKREWVGLTDEEVQMFIDARWSDGVNFTHFIRAIEAKLKEKNHG